MTGRLMLATILGSITAVLAAWAGRIVAARGVTRRRRGWRVVPAEVLRGIRASARIGGNAAGHSLLLVFAEQGLVVASQCVDPSYRVGRHRGRPSLDLDVRICVWSHTVAKWFARWRRRRSHLLDGGPAFKACCASCLTSA